MRARDVIGAAMIAAVLAIAGWFVAVSPSAQAARQSEVRSHPPAIACVWSQPWTDPAFVISGWSRPQAWWHQPDIKVTWSNAHASDVLLRAPLESAPAGWDIAIRYVAVSAPVEVLIDGQRAGALDLDAKGDSDPYQLSYHLPRVPSDGVVDIRFLTHDAVLHANDGRYLGVLLESVKACPSHPAE